MRWIWPLGCALTVLGACGGAGHLEGTVYRGPEVSYELGDIGPGWKRVSVERATDAAWARESLAAVVQINASCNPELDIPLRVLTNHLLMGFTEREVRSQQAVPMAAREALRTHVVAKLDGVPRELMLHVLKKDGCVYDFALVAPPDERFSEALRAYEAVLAGFRTLERGS